MPSTLITAKGDFPDVCVLQMFRSVSSGWGYELKACFLLWLTADGMGLAGTAAPLHRLPGAQSLSQLGGSTSLGRKGWERVTWKHSSVKRTCPASCLSFSGQAENWNQTSQLNLAAVTKSREGGTPRHKRRSEAKTCWDLGRRRMDVWPTKFGCICPGLILWFLSSLEEVERSCRTVPLPTRRFRKRQKVWWGARGSPVTPPTPRLVPFSRGADALLSQAHTSKSSVAFCFCSVGTNRVIPKREG